MENIEKIITDIYDTYKSLKHKTKVDRIEIKR